MQPIIEGQGRITQGRIARQCRVDVSTVSKILRQVPGLAFNQDTIARVFAVAQALGYDLSCLKFGHRRRTPRKQVNVEVGLTIVEESGLGLTCGIGVLRDISLEGAVLHKIMLVPQSLPIASHRIRIRPQASPARSVEMEGRIIRYVNDGDALGLAIRFTKTSPTLHSWIQSMS